MCCSSESLVSFLHEPLLTANLYLPMAASGPCEMSWWLIPAHTEQVSTLQKSITANYKPFALIGILAGSLQRED